MDSQKIDNTRLPAWQTLPLESRHPHASFSLKFVKLRAKICAEGFQVVLGAALGVYFVDCELG